LANPKSVFAEKRKTLFGKDGPGQLRSTPFQTAGETTSEEEDPGPVRVYEELEYFKPSVLV
jgi:hypothetical protein